MQNKHSLEDSSPIKLSDGQILDPFIVKLLGQRGIIGRKAISEFLEPKLTDLPSPFLMQGMDRAVAILEDALLNDSSILIWGDYDVDGTTSTALLLKFFDSLGCSAEYYIPDRLTEGYGLQEKALKEISSRSSDKNRVLVTVDNGISAHAAIRLAVDLGYKVIVTDHHTAPEEAVPAHAVLNPKQKGCTFPAKNLAGVGVAFYLAMGLRSHLAQKNFFSDALEMPNLKSLLDLVSIGTIADMVPLHGVNRVLVKSGVETMAKCSNVGITALCRASNVDPSFVRSEDISFQIAPKINAAGRLGRADMAVQLFLAKSKEAGQMLAGKLIASNDKRKALCTDQLIQAIAACEKDRASKSSVVIEGEYHIGVAGIVASNLVEKYQLPSVILCKTGEDLFRGSARSIPGVDLYKALERCKDLLFGFGGHKMAAGLSILPCNIDAFKRTFDKAVLEQSNGCLPDVQKSADAEIHIGALFKNNLLTQLHMLEPFGSGNPQPVFRDTRPRPIEIIAIGKDKDHLRLRFSEKGNTKSTQAIAFGMGKLAAKCRQDDGMEILYTPSINFFRGKRSWQVRVTEISFKNQ